jgi:hypothetical protein
VTDEGNVETKLSTVETGNNGVFTQLIDIEYAKEMTVNFAGSGAVTELKYCICSEPAPPPAECIEKVLDFDSDVLDNGRYVDHQLEQEYSVTIFAEGTGAQTFGGKARVFDTSQPWADPDLGSPNSECEGGGPGIGDGGRPESDYSNCEPLNYVLIIQEGGTNAPDDNENGGSITFTFLSPVRIEHIGLLDSDDEASPEVVVSSFITL